MRMYKTLESSVRQLQRANNTSGLLPHIRKLIVNDIYENFIENRTYFKQDNHYREAFYDELFKNFYTFLSSNLELSNVRINYEFSTKMHE